MGSLSDTKRTVSTFKKSNSVLKADLTATQRKQRIAEEEAVALRVQRDQLLKDKKDKEKKLLQLTKANKDLQRKLEDNARFNAGIANFIKAAQTASSNNVRTSKQVHELLMKIKVDTP